MHPLSFYPLRVKTIQQKWKTEVQVIGGQLLPINPGHIHEVASVTRGRSLKGLGLHQGKAPVWHKGADIRNRKTWSKFWEIKKGGSVAKTIWLIMLNIFLLSGCLLEVLPRMLSQQVARSLTYLLSVENLVENKNSGNHLASLFSWCQNQFCYFF